MAYCQEQCLDQEQNYYMEQQQQQWQLEQEYMGQCLFNQEHCLFNQEHPLERLKITAPEPIPPGPLAQQLGKIFLWLVPVKVTSILVALQIAKSGQMAEISNFGIPEQCR